MNKKKWLEKLNEIVKECGVVSYLDNEDDTPWFECPICGEPILIEDWSYDEIKDNVCPICEEVWL